MEKINLNNNTYGFKEFITINEQEELLYFINSNLSHFKSLIKREHQFASIEKIPNYPEELIQTLRKRVIELDEIEKPYPELMFEDAVSILYKDGYHGYHIDMNYGDWILTRYNIMLSVPDEGGLSVYGKDINYIEERMVWRCIAGKVKHGVTKVLSDKPRICLCMGFLIHQDELRKKTEFGRIENYSNVLPVEIEYLSPLIKWNVN